MSSDKPRGLGKRAWLTTRLGRSLLMFLAKFKIFNVTVHNRSAVPKQGAVIVASNHISMADPVFLWGALRRNAIAMAMAELWKTAPISWIMRMLDQTPVKRGDKESHKQALERSKKVLRNGGLVIIYPEGKCASGDNMLQLQRGVAILAFETGTSVIPAGIKGSNLVKPLEKGSKLNRHAHVDMRFGERLNPADFSGPDAMEDFLAELGQRISDLSERPLALAA
ncbi:MAG: lysophospholipid acyltransferase family protein [Candidatus Microsaccharimonas sp.]